MERWIIFALLSLIVFGFWGFFPKLAVAHLRPSSALVWEIAGAILVGLVVLSLLRFKPDMHPLGILYAMLTGVFGMVGTLLFFAAAREGRISVVVSMTALYPLVTILLAALLLKEPVNLHQGIGMAFALLAIWFLTS